MELRKDYILDRWVFYASERKNRPKEFKSVNKHSLAECFFCPGNENLTPPEIGRVSEKGKWSIRWFDNKFPAVDKTGKPEIITNGLFTHSSAYGKHEIIVEQNSHEKQLWDVSVEKLKKILLVYQNRIIELGNQAHTKYVLIFKNHGSDAGTSLIHSHTQVVSLSILPTLIKEEINAVSKFNKCPYCEIIRKELKSPRKCFVNKYFIAFAPYASRFNYEVWIFPRWHVNSITQISKDKLIYQAEILLKVLRKLRGINASYNFYLHNSPNKKNLHYHIEILPRLATWAGFELATDFTINSVLPEDAAMFYME